MSKKLPWEKLKFNMLEEEKQKIAKDQADKITKLYEQWAEDIAKKESYYKSLSTKSSELMEKYCKQLELQLKNESKQISQTVYNNIVGGIMASSESVVKANKQWMYSLGFSEKYLHAAFSNIPENIVQRIITGQIYENGWNLSKAIWGDNQSTLSDIHTIVGKGVAEQKPIYEISKDLESYVSPTKKNPWNYTISYTTAKGEKKTARLYKGVVDYNAQRLARTLVQHSYQQSLLESSSVNPFVSGFIWVANGGRPCEFCADMDGSFFEKDEMPMDHPNGMCTMDPVTPDDSEIADRLADWYEGDIGTDPELDEFASLLGYNDPVAGVQAAVSTGSTVAKMALDNETYNNVAAATKTAEKVVKSTPVEFEEGSSAEKIVNDTYKKLGITDKDKVGISDITKLKSPKTIYDKDNDFEDWYLMMKSNVEGTDLSLVKDILLHDGKYDQIIASGNMKDVYKAFYKNILDEMNESLAKLNSTIDTKAAKVVATKVKSKDIKETQDFFEKYFYNKGFIDDTKLTYKKWIKTLSSTDIDEILTSLGSEATLGSAQFDKDAYKFFYKYKSAISNSKFDLSALGKAASTASTKVDDEIITMYSKKEILNNYVFAKGFNKPEDLDDFAKWIVTLDNKEKGLILESMGKSWDSEHPYQLLNKFYDKYIDPLKKESKSVWTKPKVVVDKSKVISEDFSEWFAKLRSAEKEELCIKYGYNIDDIQKYYYKDILGNTKKEADNLYEQYGKKTELEMRKKFNAQNFSQQRKDGAIWCNSVDESMKRFSKYENDLWDVFTEDERRAIYGYTSGSGSFNKPLRGYERSWGIENFKGSGFVDLDSLGSGKDIEEMTKALDKCKTSKDIWLQRGVDKSGGSAFLGITESDLDLSEEELKQKLLRKTVVDRSFYSSGAAKGTGFAGNLVINTYAPRGTKMIYVNNHGAFSHSNENEFIMQRGTRFRITKISKQGYTTFVDVEVIGQI